MGNPRRPSPLLESARRRRNQGNGVTNPRIVRLTAATVVAEPDAHQSSHRTRATALADAAWTLDKPGSISVVSRCLLRSRCRSALDAIGGSRMADWRDSQIRYLVHFADGGSGLRYFDVRLVEGQTFSEGDAEYCVRRLDHTSSSAGLSHAWVEPARD